MSRMPLHRVQAAQAARRFFIAQRSKVEIAKEMGLSRFQVARLIDAAVAQGIIEFRVNEPDDLNTELGEQVQRLFGLKTVLVLDGPDLPATDVLTPLGELAARLLEETLVDQQLIAVAGGRTLAATARALERLPRVDVVQAAGTSAGLAFFQNPVEIVHSMASLSGGRAFPIYGPMWAEDLSFIERLREEPSISAALALFGRVDVLVTGIGAWPSESGLARGFPKPWTAAARRASVLADVCATLIDRDGNVVASPLDTNGVCISTEQLRRIPDVVGVAGGVEKIASLRAVLRGRWITTLITDAGAARGLLRA